MLAMFISSGASLRVVPDGCSRISNQAVCGGIMACLYHYMHHELLARVA